MRSHLPQLRPTNRSIFNCSECRSLQNFVNSSVECVVHLGSPSLRPKLLDLCSFWTCLCLVYFPAMIVSYSRSELLALSQLPTPRLPPITYRVLCGLRLLARMKTRLSRRKWKMKGLNPSNASASLFLLNARDHLQLSPKFRNSWQEMRNLSTNASPSTTTASGPSLAATPPPLRTRTRRTSTPTWTTIPPGCSWWAH